MMRITLLLSLYLYVLLISVFNYVNSAIGRSVVVDVPHEHWKLLANAKPRPTQNISFIIVIKNNDAQVSNLERKFQQVSDPSHADYGNFFSYDEIHQKLLYKTTKSGAIVAKWLQKHDKLSIRSTAHKEFLIVQSPLPVHILRIPNGQQSIKAKQFQLPSIVSDHIDYIEELYRFPIVLNRTIPKHSLADKTGSNAPTLISLNPTGKKFEFFIQLTCSDGISAGFSVCSEFRGYHVTFQTGRTTANQTVSLEKANCQVCIGLTSIIIFYECILYHLNAESVLCYFTLTYNIGRYQLTKVSVQSKFVKNGRTSYSASASQQIEKVSDVTPSLLSSLYNVSTSTLKQKRHPKSRQAVVGFSEYYNIKSFKAFAKTFGKNFNLKIGKVYGIDYKNKSYDETETALDMEYMAAMGSGIVTDYISNNIHNIGYAKFFATLATLESNKQNVVPLVYSISYGGSERTYKSEAVRMIDIHFMKMGVSGKTVFASSGDSGVWSSAGNCGNRFDPVYTSASPYVTSVGGTQLVHGINGNCRYIPQERGICLEEVAAYQSNLTQCVITSGGGFSEYHSTPTWQKTFVQHYLTSAGKRLPPSTYFNKSNRAYPDISLLAHNYKTKENNANDIVDGTSASCPAIAGLFSLINDKRLKLGMKPLGFLNPLLYQLAATNPEVYHDIVRGKNNCNGVSCCKYGFEAQKGYDPVTGLGSINHGLMMDLLT
ncbi:unnamed protein product [Didymodactylos carnosus]|uniref:Tripeptidyl-peptidase 1 n=1 Tax=Didymodactylos carnosus TaxID=1234261 RepID=A0A8S2E121_9BILA|nr:unnamed protein product [Didymodactylos carnosus]CAF3867686.1 unnamed protein product [Didymodactylos carnosus]